MGKSRFRWHARAAGLVLLASIGAARADLIIQTESILINGANFASELLDFEPFDTSLGELQEAVFSTSLTLNYSAQTTPFFDINVDGPVPTTVFGTINIAFWGIAWPFRYQGECVRQQSLVSGGTAVFPLLLNMTWRSDSQSDQNGVTRVDDIGPCPRDVLNPVQRGDYEATPLTSVAGLMLDFRTTWTPEDTTTPGGVVPNIAGGGFAMLQYFYTPHPVEPEPEPVPVPAPGTGLLLAIGLACLAAARRR